MVRHVALGILLAIWRGRDSNQKEFVNGLFSLCVDLDSDCSRRCSGRSGTLMQQQGRLEFAHCLVQQEVRSDKHWWASRLEPWTEFVGRSMFVQECLSRCLLPLIHFGIVVSRFINIPFMSFGEPDSKSS